MTTEDKFLAAVEIINSLPQNGPFQPSDDMMLKFYAYQKQATKGPCNVSKPSFWDISARNKWNAWNNLGNMTKEDAMEKYIEELAKVIETMSYNDKVSRFMSLMGPFYEVVWPEECNTKYDNDTYINKYNENVHLSSITSYDTLEFSKNVSDNNISENLQNVEERLRCLSYNTSLKPLSSSSSSLSSECEESCRKDYRSSTIMTESDVINILKNKRVPNFAFLSAKDILILTLMNMQNSLEDIREHLERLHALAKANMINQQILHDNLESNEWKLSVPAAAFAFFWPIAVHFYMNSNF